MVRILLAVWWLLAVCQAIELQEIRPISPHGITSRSLTKRDMTVFDLQSKETFLWGAEDGSEATLGNLTVQFPGETENILSMEKFDGLLTDVECNDKGLSLTFEDDEAFAYAKKVWDWVNGDDDHSFLMVAGKGDCGDNPYRIPYLVSALAYDEDKNTAKLTATTGPWKKLIHTYELNVGKVPLSDDLGLKRRFDLYNKDTTIGLDFSFRPKLKVRTSAVFGEFNCNPCATTGSIRFEFAIKVENFLTIDLTFLTKPSGVSASADISLELASNYNSKQDIEKRWSLGKIPLAGIVIPPDILTLGPVIDFQVGIEITWTEIGIKISTGAKATLSDDAIINADLLHPSKNKFSGWDVILDTKPIQLQARASGYIKIYIEPTLQLEGEAIGFGFGTGVRLKMPYIDGRMEVVDSPGGGACEPGDKNELAARLRASWGFELTFTAGKINGEQDVDVILGQSAQPIGGPICFPFIGVKPSNAPGLPAPSTPGTGPTPPVPTSGGKPCTAGGKTGTCVSTASCKSSGGTSTKGQCPNDPADIQCCTTNAPNTCKVGTTSGTCISTASCKASGSDSTPGKCPNDPKDVQCCTKPFIGPVVPKTCKVGTASGNCVSTSACKTTGGISTPGKCPDDPEDIQCCTKAEAPPAPKSCKVGSTSGTCIATGSCKSTGGKSTPGKCPDDPEDIQCCTKEEAPPAPKTCKVGSTSGTCISTSSCKSTQGISTPGKCPDDPDDIQCCTKAPPPAAPKSCKVGTTSGTCIATAACKSSGSISTPGKCPDDPDDVQCCTKPPPPAAPKTCKVGDISGTCLATAACKDSGGKSTKGKCPDDPQDIQCCTKEAPKPCKVGALSGTCVATAECKASGGTSTKGQCPDDPADIQCCTKETGGGGYRKVKRDGFEKRRVIPC